MRELVFALEYEPGCNRVADTLAKYPDTRIRSVSLHATADHCGATQRTQVLESTGDMLVLYSYWERMSSCASVPHMALEHLGRGALFVLSGKDFVGSSCLFTFLIERFRRSSKNSQ